MFPWWMLRPEPEVDLDVMHHAEDVEDDSDRVWVGHGVLKKKRHRREKDKQRDAELPLVIYLEGFGTANWKFMNTYM